MTVIKFVDVESIFKSNIENWDCEKFQFLYSLI